MTAARTAIGNFCFKKSVSYILQKCNWLTAQQMINYASIKTIHSVIKTGVPRSIYKYFKINKRTCSEITPKVYPMKKFSRELYLYKALNIYNKLPTNIKILNPKQFKLKAIRHLKSYQRVP